MFDIKSDLLATFEKFRFEAEILKEFGNKDFYISGIY